MPLAQASVAKIFGLKENSMPGFVDVSGMTYEDVRRMGHADDYDHETKRYGRVAPPRNNPVLQIGHSVSDVWAAACAAQRINGEYVKESTYTHNEASGQTVLDKRRNRDIMMEFLQNPDRLLVEDVEAGEQVREFLQKDLTFRALKGQLTEFDSATSKCVAVTDRFYTVSHRYEMAVIASLPNSARRSQTRQTVDSRLKFATGGLIGKPGDKITANIEVLSANYSQQYNIFWIRGITDQDQPVMFSNKEKFDAGTRLTVQGKVKAHRDNSTQLNYVKVL
jgi:hypothetical protein